MKDQQQEALALDTMQLGIRLYTEWANQYALTKRNDMHDVLANKALSRMRDFLEAHELFILQFGHIVAQPAEENKKSGGELHQLQWQEGTVEPEDEPNLSNGVDILPKKVPTKQPWDNASRSGMPTHEILLIVWLAYETEAERVYQAMEEKYPTEIFWHSLRKRTQDEIEKLRNSL